MSRSRTKAEVAAEHCKAEEASGIDWGSVAKVIGEAVKEGLQQSQACRFSRSIRSNNIKGAREQVTFSPRGFVSTEVILNDVIPTLPGSLRGVRTSDILQFLRMFMIAIRSRVASGQCVKLLDLMTFEARKFINEDDAYMVAYMSNKTFNRLSTKIEFIGKNANLTPEQIEAAKVECIARQLDDIEDDEERERKELAWVTPDMMVTCPKCRHEFRIGRPERGERFRIGRPSHPDCAA